MILRLCLENKEKRSNKKLISENFYQVLHFAFYGKTMVSLQKVKLKKPVKFDNTETMNYKMNQHLQVSFFGSFDCFDIKNQTVSFEKPFFRKFEYRKIHNYLLMKPNKT